MNDADKSCLRVLIVDRCRETSTSMCWLLEKWGHHVRVAHDGVAALEIAGAFRPQVVLIDITLETRWDGCQLASQFRALSGLEQVYLICMSAYATEADQRRSLEAGFNYLLPKGTDPQEVKSVLTARKATAGARVSRAHAVAENAASEVRLN